MASETVRGRVRLQDRATLMRTARVVGVLLVVVAFAYWPHLDAEDDVRLREDFAAWEMTKAYVDRATGDIPGYPYPLHYDELVHWSVAAGIQRHNALDAPGLSLRGLVHERAYHVALAGFQEVTGIGWLPLIEYGPAAMTAFLAFAMYAMMRPHPGALPAAALVALVPTTPRFLGPAFLVPVSIALAWVFVAVILATGEGPRRTRLALLAVVVAGTFFIHLVIGLVGVLVLVSLLAARGLRGDESGLRPVLAVMAGVAMLGLVFFGDVVTELTRTADRSRLLAFVPRVFTSFGVRSLVFWAAASAWLVLTRRPRPGNDVPLAFALASGAMLAVIAGAILTQTQLYILYDRWHVPFFIAAAVPMGAGVAAFAGWVGRRLRGLGAAKPWAPRLGKAEPVTAFALGAVLITSAAPYLATEPYYEVLQDADWRAITWIRDNLGPEYNTVLTKRLAGPAVTAETGKCVFRFNSAFFPAYYGSSLENRTAMLHDAGITVVMRTVVPPEGVFQRVGPDVWAVDPPTARELAKRTGTAGC